MSSKKRLSISVAALVTLCLSLCICSFALGYTFMMVENNMFNTGVIDIELHDNEFILADGRSEFLFEPGMTVFKTFSIENRSADPDGIYYKMYFKDITGLLADVIDVTILDSAGNTVLSGKLADLTREKVTMTGSMSMGQNMNFTAQFHYPEASGNEGQGTETTFILCAEAVQAKNNPSKSFN